MAGFLARRIDAAVRSGTRAAMEESGALIGPQIARAADQAMTELGPRVRREFKRTKRRMVLGTVGAGAGAGAVMSAPQWVMLERDRRERKEMASMRKSNDDVNLARLAGAIHPVAAGGYGAYKGKKGRKAQVGLRTTGRSWTEGVAGMIPGAVVGGAGTVVMQRSPKVGAPLMALGGLGTLAGAIGGQAHGAGAAYRNAVRRGDVVASKSMWRDGVPLSGLAKAWKGERGDKRNTKYYLAGVGGATLGYAGADRLPVVRRPIREAQSRMIGSVQDSLGEYERTGVPPEGVFRRSGRAYMSAPGIKRAHLIRAGAGLGGAALAAGAYGAYRQTDGSKRRRSARLEKAMTPRKLAAFRRMQSSPSAAGEYSRLRMGNYLRGEGATPMRGARGDAFRNTVRGQSLDSKMKMRFVTRSANNSSILGRPARPLP